MSTSERMRTEFTTKGMGELDRGRDQTQVVDGMVHSGTTLLLVL